MNSYIANKIEILLDNGMRLGQLWSNVNAWLEHKGIDMFYASEEEIEEVLQEMIENLS